VTAPRQFPFMQPKEDGIRYYEKDGEKYPSVTSVLGILGKKALVPWAAKCVADYTANRLDHSVIYSKSDIVKHLTECRNAWVWESDKASTIGTNVHDMAEAIINPSVECTTTVRCKEEENGMCAFYEWLASHDVKVVETETTIFGNGYAGRIDLIAYVDGVLTLVDLKTSKSIYREYRLQVAAYAKAWNIGKPEHEQIKCIAILRLCKETGHPEYKDITRTMDKDYADFLALTLFFALHKSKDIPRAVVIQAELSQLFISIMDAKGKPKPRKAKVNVCSDEAKGDTCESQPEPDGVDNASLPELPSHKFTLSYSH